MSLEVNVFSSTTTQTQCQQWHSISSPLALCTQAGGQRQNARRKNSIFFSSSKNQVSLFTRETRNKHTHTKDLVNFVFWNYILLKIWTYIFQNCWENIQQHELRGAAAIHNCSGITNMEKLKYFLMIFYSCVTFHFPYFKNILYMSCMLLPVIENGSDSTICAHWSLSCSVTVVS